MADFNLIPDPKLLLTQGFVFWVNYRIIKKFMIEPYLKQRENREGWVSNKYFEAKKLLEKHSRVLEIIQQRVDEAHEKIKRQRADSRSTLLKEQQAECQLARSKMQGDLKSFHLETRGDYEQAKRNLNQVVDRLSEKITNIILKQ